MSEQFLFIHDNIKRGGYVTIVAESFRPSFALHQPMLASIAEVVSRPPLMHVYHLTPFSLGAAVSNGVSSEEAVSFLQRHAHRGTGGGAVADFITACMQRYDLARIATECDRSVLQCRTDGIARQLAADPVLRLMIQPPAEPVPERATWGEETAAFPTLTLQSRAVSKLAAARCVVLGLPIQQQYDYEGDTSVRAVNITLRSQTRPRRYQVEAVEAATSAGSLRSGCLLLPCGAGKTLVGIMILCKVKRPALIVCAGSVSVEQWRSQILEFASLDAPLEAHMSGGRGGGDGKRVRAGVNRIACMTGKQKDPITEDTDVVLTTYSMLVSAHRIHSRRRATHEDAASGDGGGAGGSPSAGQKRGKAKTSPKEMLFAPYGLVILDEVHVIPAEAFRESLGLLDCRGVVGLTATYVREDAKILDLYHLVGPKLYDVSMESLVADGYLAKVHCAEVHTPLTPAFQREYLDRCVSAAGRRRSVPAMVMLAAANPYKMLCVRELVRRHLQAGAKILVFCDHIALLHEYGRVLSAPVVCGATQHKDRLMLFSDFQSTSKVNLICISRVGDVSVNLPSASVVIQVSSHGGSRRQEAQRLGRILRPKERHADGSPAEAYFYSIVSMDTLEVSYAAHRTTFLVDQGYSCRVMRYEPPPPRPPAEPAAGAADKLGCKRPRDVDDDGEEAEAAKVPKRAPPAETKVEVGDSAAIKRENFHSAVLGSTLRHGDDASPASGAARGAVDVMDLQYQIGLLAKVVSSWEMSFQKELRADALRGDADAAAGDAESGTEESSDSGDSDVVAVAPARGLREVKREYATNAAAVADVATTRQRNLSDLVGVDDAFVYHEL